MQAAAAAAVNFAKVWCDELLVACHIFNGTFNATQLLQCNFQYNTIQYMT